MKFEIESSDISAIAEMVILKLMPMFDELKRDTSIKSSMTSTVNDSVKSKSKVVNTKELLSLTGLSRSTIWRLENEGTFPARRRLSGKRVGWIRMEVDAWLASLIKASTRKRFHERFHENKNGLAVIS